MANNLDFEIIEPKGVSSFKNQKQESSLPEGFEYIDKPTPQEKKSSLSDTMRTMFQLPLGLLKKWTWPADVLKMMSQGEAYAAITEMEERLPELKKKFPQLNWPDSIDRAGLEQKIAEASEVYPTQGLAEKMIEEKTGIPLEPQTRTQRLLRLGGEAAGFKPGGIASKAIAGAVAPGISKTAEIARVPEPIADMIGALGSQISLKGLGKIDDLKMQQLISRAEKIGMTEREIAPLMQSPFKRKLFQKFAAKGRKTEKLSKDINEMLGGGYQDLIERSEAAGALSEEKFLNSMKDLSAEWNKLPSGVTKLIADDLKALYNSEGKAADFINFWQDMNYNIAKGDRILGKLKEPVGNAIKEISPELYKDFELTNELYSKYAGIRKSLNPTDYDRFFSLGELAGVGGATLTGMITGRWSPLIATAGLPVFRKVSQEMLTNPRLFNLAKKFATSSAKTQKFILPKIAKEIAKIDPKIAKEIETIDFSKL